MDHSKIFKVCYSNKIQQIKPIVAIVDGKAVFLTWRIAGFSIVIYGFSTIYHHHTAGLRVLVGIYNKGYLFRYGCQINRKIFIGRLELR